MKLLMFFLVGVVVGWVVGSLVRWDRRWRP
jgi:hypothetical protein